GPISPARFIPVAEQSGLIVPIGRWVMERACADALRAGDAWEGVGVAVNVSAVQVREPGFVDDVARTLRESGPPARRLVLELPESVLVDDKDVAAQLCALRDLGVRIAVDDFGTGYSSLSYLRELEVDAVKIDRSFIDTVDGLPRDAALVRSIVEL